MSSVFERVSRFVEENYGCTADQVCRAVPAVPGVTDEVLGRLERAGFIFRFQVRREARYRSLKPYRGEA